MRFYFINDNLNLTYDNINSRLRPPQEEEILRKQYEGIVAVLMTLVILPVMITAQTETTTELSDIQVTPLENRLEVKLEVTTPSNYESFSLFNPNRLVLDLLNIENFSVPPEIPVNDYGVQQIRTAKNQPDVTRVVFDLEDTAPAYSIEEKEDGIYLYFEPVEPAVTEETPIQKPEQEGAKKDVTPPAETEKKEEEKPAEEKQAPKEIQEPAQVKRGRQAKGLALSIAGGAYMVQDSNFQDVYGTNALSYGGDLTYFLPVGQSENLGVSLDIRYISVTGQTTYTNEDVELSLIPFSLSLVFQRVFGKVGPYAGVGLSYINYKETYPEAFVIPEMSGSAMGYHLVLGTTINFIKSFGAKAFFKLHSAKKTINEMDVNFGGTEVGLGLFYKFEF
jgi:hypothetical protein